MPISHGPGLSQGQAINIRPSAHENQIHDEGANTVTSAASYKTIYTYTSTDANTRVLQIEASAATFGHYRIKVDGSTIRERYTSGSDPNANFIFIEPRTLADTEVLTVEFKPYRMLTGVASHATFTALEGYIGL